MPFGQIHYNAPGDTFEEFVEYVADTGFDCIEVMITDVWPKDAEYNEDLAHEAKALLLRTEGGQPKDEVPEDKWAEAIAGCLKACLPFCQDMGVKMAVDNHGVVSNDPAVMLGALEMVSSPYAGSNLDTMNYRWWGNAVEDLPGIYKDIAPYVLHTHMKDGTGSRENYQGIALGQGEIPLQVVIDELVAVNYQGVWCAEWEGKGDKGEGYAACLAWMKENCPG